MTLSSDEARRRMQRALNNEKASKEAKDVHRRAVSGDEDDQLDNYASEPLHGTKWMIAGNGPTVWVHIIRDDVGEIEFGVVEVSDFDGVGFAVLDVHEAEVVDLALREADR